MQPASLDLLGPLCDIDGVLAGLGDAAALVNIGSSLLRAGANVGTRLVAAGRQGIA